MIDNSWYIFFLTLILFFTNYIFYLSLFLVSSSYHHYDGDVTDVDAGDLGLRCKSRPVTHSSKVFSRNKNTGVIALVSLRGLTSTSGALNVFFMTLQCPVVRGVVSFEPHCGHILCHF